MAEVTLDLIKKLREQTQVGMMDCKKALQDTNGDYEKAVELLRKKGASVAAKRADNETNNGTIAALVSPDFTSAALVEVSCETDFSANSEALVSFANDVAQHALAAQGAIAQGDTDRIDQLLSEQVAHRDNLTLQQCLDELISKICEKITISRVARFTNEGLVNAYVHPGSNLGVMVELDLDGARPADITPLVNAAKEVCMQIAVTNPLCVNPEEVDPAALEKEREVYAAQLREQGKPEAMINNIVEGKLKKFYQSVCLTQQAFIKDEKQSIEQMLAATSKEVGVKLTIRQFVRFAIGAK